MKMRLKILLFCLSSTLCALILQTVFFQNISSSLIYNQAKQESSNLLENMQNEIYIFIKSIESNLIEIYNEKDFAERLKSGESIKELKKKYVRLAYTFATENFDTSNGVVALYIYNSNHEIISTYRRAVTPKHNYPVDIYEEISKYNADKVMDYVASNNTNMLISSYYNEHRETNIARFVLKIYDNANTKKKIGYIVCDIDSKVLKRIMEKYCNNEQMFMWIQPLEDRPILSSGTLEDANQEYFRSDVSQIEKGTFEKISNTGKEQRVLFYVEQKKYNLGAYSLQPQALLKQNERTLTQSLILIGIFMSFVIIIVSVFITKSLTKPLENLTDTISKIKSGQTNQRVECCNNDEIGELGRKFNEMIDEIQNLISHEYETKLLLNKAEYKALQAQINPHFLYNTLDTMGSIASIQNCQMVSNLSQSLSNIFRYSLDIKHPFSTVSKEIVHLKNYIYVMNVRMGEMISYEFNISDDVLLDSIPRISIQPIVENALNHGLRNKRGDKRIEINAFESDEKLMIIVKDNGIGMDAVNMNQKLKENNKDLVEAGSSIGLFNINARLKMLYGNEYGLFITSEPDVGTDVCLTIPKIKIEEVETWRS